MAQGLRLINTSGRYLIDSSDTNEILYQRRSASEGSGTITTGDTNYDTETSVLFNTTLENSLVFIRPTNITAQRDVVAYTRGSRLYVTSDGGADVEYIVFDRVTDLTKSSLETGYGLNVYKDDGTTLHWSSNALNARIHSIVQNLGGSATLSEGWSSVLRMPYRYDRVNIRVNNTLTGFTRVFMYVPRWKTDGSIQIVSVLGKETAISGYWNTQYFDYFDQTLPKLLIADLGDI